MADSNIPAEAEAGFRFPDEAFACPRCGQMLAPYCRVCVACKQPIDPHRIVKAAPPQTVEDTHAQAQDFSPILQQTAKFSWSIFFVVLGIWLLAAGIAEQSLGYAKGQLALGSIVLLSSVWVFHDAQRKGIPKPFRWGIGSLLLWILVFPWYLARRRTPEAPCPFIEAETRSGVRALLLALIAFFLVGVILMLLKGPKPH